jgi:hypothetical protein
VGPERVRPHAPWTEHTLRAAIDLHRRNWWKDDPGVAGYVHADPDLLTLAEAGALSTADVHYRGPDRHDRSPALWTPQRQALHEELTQSQVGIGAPPQQPLVYLTIGPMGSGKTSRLRPLVHAHRRSRGLADPASLSRIAADDVREALPEYASGLGNEIVTPECFDITYGPVFEAVLRAGHDIVFDTIGTLNPGGEVTSGELLRRLRGAGFLIDVLLAQAPLSTCVDRAHARALSDNGRLINVEQHEITHEQPAKVLSRLLTEPDLVREWVVLDTYSPEVPAPMIDASPRGREYYDGLADTPGGNA